MTNLGIIKLEAIVYYVHNLERSIHFHAEIMDLQQLGESSLEHQKENGEHSVVFQGADCRVIATSPLEENSRSWRYLQRQPDGIGTLVFEVEDIDHTFGVLIQRGGTPVGDVQSFTDETGKYQTFSITTPFGGAAFQFVQRENYRYPFPGFQPGLIRLGNNKFGFQNFDHVTTNFETMAPALLWMEHVMGFERYWNIEFHTSDISTIHEGTGLRSVVMWDPYSGVKFANNEPWRPAFENSQINQFTEENRGDGIQHVALTVKDILPTVTDMRKNGVPFLRTPGTYYDVLPDRLVRIGIGSIDEDIELLREAEVLVDGRDKNSYMLQIFMENASNFYNDSEAGSFFYELIQRKGDKGFGGGNFRALFESIEQQQGRLPC
jgi:4-hydroxyphenylpyruvate dioxygenase